MWRTKYVIFLSLWCTHVVFIFLLFTLANAQSLHMAKEKAQLHPKLESVIDNLEKEFQEDPLSAKASAQSKGIKIGSQNTITVYLIFKPGTDIDEASLQSCGAKVIKGAKNVVKIRAPINMLKTIADTVEGVSFIKFPDRPIPTAIQTQGVALTGASSYHADGYTGTGVKVGIIDTGFAGLSSAIANNELPNDVIRVDCTGSSCVSNDFSSETERHGTACAEIVHDMAPGSTLYLIKVSDSLDEVDAKNYCINNSIDIISSSVSYYNTNFYSGECYNSNPVCSANDAYAHGILWVNAAGNRAKEHYEATFTDSDNDGWHNISGDDETINISASKGDIIKVYLTWNAWPTTNQDYDLYLYDSSFNQAATSVNSQTGTQPPTEMIRYSVPVTGTYYVAIDQWSASSNHDLEVYSYNLTLNPSVSSSSLGSPADAPSVMAVGAMYQGYWTTGPQESSSSQGPTNDGRTKPEICGPDGVVSHTYGSFWGTSAATPHVAGAAALVLSKHPEYSVGELEYALVSLAIDMGSSGKDNIYGHGRLNLSTEPAPEKKSGHGDGGCFIATAAYGSSMSDELIVLTKFRDEVLLTNALGRKLVKFYYKTSPLIANYIQKHDFLKATARLTLTPIVYLVKYPKIFVLIFLFLTLNLGLILFRRRRFQRV